jgi:hypothetical protein
MAFRRGIVRVGQSACGVIGLSLTLGAAAQVEDGGNDEFALVNAESGFSLVNPQPRPLWREMSADRPDTTESPFTVPAGAVQLEMSFVDYAKNGSEKVWTLGAANLKLGLFENVDLQLVFDSWIRADDGAGSRREGFGDAEIRLKINLWGNDGERDTAFAVMPYVKLPTAADDLGNDHVEGGLILPYAIDLAEGVGLGLMAEFDAVHDEEDDDCDLEFVHTAAVGFDLSERIGWYIEGVGIAATDGPYRALAGTGFTFAVRDDVVFDVGVNLGLEGDVDDVNVFTGVTIRF